MTALLNAGRAADDEQHLPTDAGPPTGPSVAGRSLNLVQNSIALIGAKVAIMSLGFIFWLVAARQFDAGTVGLAAGAVSAVMLCTQFALLGVGSSFITHLPAHRARPHRLLHAATTLVAVASAVAALLFLLFSGIFLDELATLAREPLFDVAFVLVAVVGTLGILLDQVSTAFRRGDQALARNLVSGGITLGHLVLLAVLMRNPSANAIFATWLTGGVALVAVGYVQMRGPIPAYRYRPVLGRRVARELLGVGIPNHLLTLTERLPGFVLPIVVTELLSPAQNAHWYTAWMMAWVVYIIPIQVGMTLFAEATDEPHQITAHLRRGIKTSLVLGVLAACGAALLAPVALGLLGPGYAAAAVTPLRILVIGVVPLTVIHGYFAVCRATRRLGEALVVGTISAVGGTVAASVAAVGGGLPAMAATWVAALTVACIWAAFRLHSLMRLFEEPMAVTSDIPEFAVAARTLEP